MAAVGAFGVARAVGAVRAAALGRRARGNGARGTQPSRTAASAAADGAKTKTAEPPAATAEADADWEKVEELYRSGEAIECNVVLANRGGVVVTMPGKVRGFVPFMQLDHSRIEPPTKGMDIARRMEPLVGKSMKVSVTELDSRKREAVLSEKLVSLKAIFETLEEGQEVSVRIKKLADFGAFATLLNDKGNSIGADGLIHVSEISWSRVNRVADYLTMNQVVQAKIINVDTKQQRVGLSIKAMGTDPTRETLDDIMPVDGYVFGSEGEGTTEALPGLDNLVALLMAEDGVAAVTPGRKAVEQCVVSQDLELWLTNSAVEDGYNVLARAGRLVQEIHVATDMDRPAFKQVVRNVTQRLD